MKHKVITLHTDGGARGNPGPAGIGVAIFDGDTLIEEYKEFIGNETNNTSEYKGLIAGLEHASKHTNNELNVFMDSQLVVNQVKGLYKINHQHLRELHAQVKEREKLFLKVTYTFVRREHEKQQVADRLANEAMDNGVQ